MNKLINFYKILSDETRLRIVMLLYKEELCVCEICGALDLSQPKVSKHLSKLRNMGFVKDNRKEQFVFYRLNLEDKVIKETIKLVVDNLDNYPELKEDAENLQKKEEYLNKCKSKQNK